MSTMSLIERMKVGKLKALTAPTGLTHTAPAFDPARSKAGNGETPTRLKVSLTTAQELQIEERAKARGVSKATIVRELIDSALRGAP